MKEFVLLVIITLLYTKEVKMTDISNYGPYTVRWDRFENCEGVKNTDCGSIRVENKQNMSNLRFVLDFSTDCSILKGKVTAGSINNKNKTMKKLWNYYLNSPCKHFVLGPILIKAFNLTNNCKITKGHYEVHLNMEQTTKNFFGSNFYYGLYIFKTMTFNTNKNVFCFQADFEIAKV